MNAITIKQPWPQLICEGLKDIENRTWPTKYRGRVLIHAAATEVKDGIDLVSCINGEAARRLWFLQNDKKIYYSAIIGSVEIVDCVLNNSSIWAQHKATVKRKIKGKVTEVEVPVYNWILANPILFPEPIPAKGKLSFWDYPNILAEPEEEDGELFCHCQLPIDNSNLGEGYDCLYCGGKLYQ